MLFSQAFANELSKRKYDESDWIVRSNIVITAIDKVAADDAVKRYEDLKSQTVVSHDYADSPLRDQIDKLSDTEVGIAICYCIPYVGYVHTSSGCHMYIIFKIREITLFAEVKLVQVDVGQSELKLIGLPAEVKEMVKFVDNALLKKKEQETSASTWG